MIISDLNVIEQCQQNLCKVMPIIAVFHFQATDSAAPNYSSQSSTATAVSLTHQFLTSEVVFGKVNIFNSLSMHRELVLF